MKRLWSCPIAALLVIACAGCSSQTDFSAAQARVIDAPADEVLRAAEALLRQEFGGVRIERQSRRLITEPTEFTTSSESGTARDLVRARSRMRRTASLTVVEREGGSLARVRVDMDRLDSAQREAVQPEAYRLSDSPGYTAIERDAATTRRQNAVWTPVGRDRGLERTLLTDLEAKFNPGVQPSPRGEAVTESAPEQAEPIAPSEETPERTTSEKQD